MPHCLHVRSSNSRLRVLVNFVVRLAILSIGGWVYWFAHNGAFRSPLLETGDAEGELEFEFDYFFNTINQSESDSFAYNETYEHEANRSCELYAFAERVNDSYSSQTYRYPAGAVHFSADSRHQCNNRTELFIAIKSAYGNTQRRQALRSTCLACKRCGASDQICTALCNRTTYAFFISTPEQIDNVTSDRVQKERNAFGDLVQISVNEHYDNLTLKTVSCLLWAVVYCRQARYVLSTDDDMVVLLGNLWRAILAIERNSTGFLPIDNVMPALVDSNRQYRANYLGGRIARKEPVHRTGKYAVNTKAYSASQWPTFLKGWFVLMSADVAVSILETSMCVRLLRLEDVNLFGILPEALGIPLAEIPNLKPYWEIQLKKFACDSAVGLMTHSDKMTAMLWKACA